ncbi:MAG: cob(I)yrinic acid a,c-diamide adenosyltransferase [Armatimonadota bacterium]
MLFTGNGDTGYTNIIGGRSLLKSDLRIEAVGALDETQAHLGLARALLVNTTWTNAIIRVQADLRLLMAECATIPTEGLTGIYLTSDHVKLLEKDLAEWEAKIGKTQGGFVIPGDSMLDAHLHLARTVVRRAERQVVALQQEDGVPNGIVLTYLNRLSSWIFALIMVTKTTKGTPRGDIAA